MLPNWLRIALICKIICNNKETPWLESGQMDSKSSVNWLETLWTQRIKSVGGLLHVCCHPDRSIWSWNKERMLTFGET